MKTYIKLALSAVLLISLVFASFTKGTSSLFVEMEVKGVSLDAIGQSPVVILSTKDETKILPIWIGFMEASAIEKELSQTVSPRPLTHDLLQSILARMQVKVKEVKIVDLKENTYHATLFLASGKGVIEMDARPSDAIVLALKSKAPVLVSAKILEKQAVAFSKKEEFGERFGIRIQTLTPELASHFEFKAIRGVLVSEVAPASPAETSGLRPGDIITRLNSEEIAGIEEFEKAIDGAKKGDPIRILFFRDGKFREVKLQPGP